MKTLSVSDAPHLAALELLCFGDNWQWSETSFKTALEEPTSFGWLLEEGSYILCRMVADEVEVLSIGTAPQLRRQGLARILLQTAMEEAKARLALVMFLEVASDNAGAEALYRSEGFQEVGRRPAYYPRGTTKIDGLILRYDIN